jgi:hypothetical protein
MWVGKVRLHCPDGPAVRWSDGYGLYFWHGVRLPRRIVESQDVRAIHRLRNTEVRRAAIERLGWPAASSIRPLTCTLRRPYDICRRTLR